MATKASLSENELRDRLALVIESLYNVVLRLANLLDATRKRSDA